MEYSGNFSHDADQDIISRLRQPGIEKRRTEDQLFNRFSYYIKEGIHKYALSEYDSFNA